MSEEKKAFEFDEKVAEQLNRLFQTEALKKLRNNLFDFLDVRSGERVLDIGCGTAANAIALVQRLEGKCSVTGIDNSEPMLVIARHNLQKFPFRDQVELRLGDAHEFPFPDGQFDLAMIIQVLEYSKEPIRLLQETKRVLKSGGRLLLVDTDWDTIVWNSNQKERTRKIVVNWSDHEADGWQGRKILEYLKRAEFHNIRGKVFTIAESSFAESNYSFCLTQIITDYLVRSEKMTRAEVDDWIRDLQQKHRVGHFYFSLNRYVFLGEKS